MTTSSSRRKATVMHRRRAAARGLVRVEVQARKADAALIRAVAALLRSDADRAREFRASLESTLRPSPALSALDAFASDLPDDAFEGVFDQPRARGWRKLTL